MNFYRVAGVLSLLLLFSISVWSAPLPTPSPNPSPSPPAKQTTESFWAMLLRISGISATPRNQRGPQTGKTGQVWVAFLDNKTRRRVATNDTGFSTPVFFPDGQSILAVQGNDVIKLSVADGSKQKVTEVKGIIKLVGFDTTDLDSVNATPRRPGVFPFHERCAEVPARTRTAIFIPPKPRQQTMATSLRAG